MTVFAPWQQRIYQQAGAALDAGRLGHGLLLCGPPRLGQRAVAERLAARMLCTSRTADGEPCGGCRSCRLFAVRSQTDPVELRPDGSLAHPWGHTGHPDFSQISYGINARSKPLKSRAEIVIEQVRKLSEQMALTPQYGEAKVAIIDPADALNHAAANALLKTLEEPVPGRYLWLVSAYPSRLPATIRSRCQRLEFRLPPHAEALAWLQAQGHGGKPAAEALEAARGHPGLADAWLRDGSLDLRREVSRDLEAVGRGNASAAATAQAWTADDHATLRLRFAADLALEQVSTAASTGLTDARRTRRLAAWFDAANRTAALLRTTVRADLAVAELLLDWQEGS